MSDLAEFLLARIADDEDAARSFCAVLLTRELNGAGGELADFEVPGAPGDPVRVLAECEAKRRIVEQHDDVHDCPSVDWEANDLGGAGWIGCDVLRLLALPYADHPAHREEWRP